MNESAVKAGFAPFIHSGSGIKKWYVYIIAATLPALIVVITYEPALILTAAVSMAGFSAGAKIASLRSRSCRRDGVYLKYILWALFYTVFAGGAPPAAVFFIPAAAAAAESILEDRQKKFPSFVIALLLMASFGMAPAVPGEGAGITVAIIAGIIFLLVNRVIPPRFLFGVASGVIFSRIFNPLPGVVMPLFAVLLFAPPGLIPEGGVYRFVFGAVAGALVGFLGLPGVYLSFLLKAVL